LSSAARRPSAPIQEFPASGTHWRRLSGSKQLGELGAAAVEHRGHLGKLEALEPIVIRQVDRRAVEEFNDVADVDELPC